MAIGIFVQQFCIQNPSHYPNQEMEDRKQLCGNVLAVNSYCYLQSLKHVPMYLLADE